MTINRDGYLDTLWQKRGNGLVKIITGVRRCGKSYILFNLFRERLLSSGVDPGHIISLALDSDENAQYRNPILLGDYLRSMLKSDGMNYILLDEVQFVVSVINPAFRDSGLPVQEMPRITLFDVLNGLQGKNTDIYITGSNSRMLSKDLVTEFRGRGDQVLIMPLSFKEFYAFKGGDCNQAWNEYLVYGGMPKVLSFADNSEKMKYLQELFSETYIKDIINRNRIERPELIEDLISILSSSAGSLTSIDKIVKTINSVKHARTSNETMYRYTSCLLDSMLFYQAMKYDVKGRGYIDSTIKYYPVDTGLRNAVLGWRQTEETHLMENVIFLELLRNGFTVDVGTVSFFSKDNDKKTIRTSCEIDFVARKGNTVFYIQSALSIPDEDKYHQEVRPLLKTGDNYPKFIIEKNCLSSGMYDENGIRHIDLFDFLLGRIQLP